MNDEIKAVLDEMRAKIESIAASIKTEDAQPEDRIARVLSAHNISGADELEKRLARLDWFESCRKRAHQFEEEEILHVEQALQLRVARCLAEMDGDVGRRDLMRRVRLHKRQFDACIDALVDAGKVVTYNVPTNGRQLAMVKLA
jgi:hypothetical protein